jgi:hypothetical protein
MATPQTQSYENHAHTPRPTGVAGAFGAIGFLILLVGLFRAPTLQNLGLVLLAMSVLTLVAISRLYTVKLQDRIIRMEMQRRLDRIGRGELIERLSMPQIVSLRFAADEELPGLLDRTLAGNLAPGQIKQAISDWQADHHRT